MNQLFKGKQYEVTQKGVWRRFLNILRESNLPKYLLAGYIILYLLQGQLLIKIPEVNGNFFSGDVSVSSVSMFIGCEVLAMLIGQVELYVNHVLRYRMNRNLRNSLWVKILRLKPGYHDQVSPSSLISRVTTDTESFNTFVLDVVFELGFQIYILAITVREMSKISVKIGFLLLAFMPITFVISFIVGRLRMRFENRIRASFADFTAYLSEIIAVLPLLKSLNRQKYETERGKEAIDRYYVANRKSVILTIISDFIYSFAGIGPEIVIFIFGIRYLSDGTFDSESWYMFYMYAGTFIGFCGTLASMWTHTKEIQGSLYKVSDILYEEGESLDEYVKEIVESEDILADQVSFGYDEKKVLDHISFTVKHNQANMLIGPSGAGKSTVLKLMERLYEPDEGRILMGGKNISEYPLRDWRNNVAYVSQNTPLFSGTIRENITYGIRRDVSDDEIMKACEMTHLLGYINELEDGLSHQVGQFGERLSGGQRQKISVARALLSDASILILDEPTASLDITSTHEIMETIEQLKGHRTVITVTHDLEVIGRGDHIIVLNKDHSVEEGSPAEIARISTFYMQMKAGKEGDR